VEIKEAFYEGLPLSGQAFFVWGNRFMQERIQISANRFTARWVVGVLLRLFTPRVHQISPAQVNQDAFAPRSTDGRGITSADKSIIKTSLFALLRLGVGSARPLANPSALLVCLLLYVSTAMMGEALAATYYWQEDSGTSIAGFTTDSPACGAQPRDIFITTTMSAGGFNCTSLRQEVRDPPPQDMLLMINDTAYAVATDVTGVDFSLRFFDDASGGVTLRYELGYAQGGVFTSWGFVDEGPHEPDALYVTDLSSISGTAPAGSHLALKIIDVAPSPGDLRSFFGSTDNSGILNVTETAATASSTIGDGTSPSNKFVAVNGTNNAVNAFTLSTDSGTDTLTDLTVTFTGTDVNDVAASGVKIYEDNGSTANEWDLSDTLVTNGTASFSGANAAFTGLNIGINTTPTQYLITYDIDAGATGGNTLQGAVTAATVTNTLVNNDNNDATLTVFGCPGGVVTTTTDSALGSLRACIIWANGNPGADTLTLPAGTYALTIAGTGEDAAATGDLDITDNIVINGDAVTPTIIDANGIDRVFEILGAGATLSNLTIRNGNVTADGGGIALDATASLTLSGSTVSGNTTTADGGGIVTAGGTVVLTNVTISGNTANRGGGLQCAGPCTLTNVTVTQNTAPANGDGLRQRTGSGTITFLNTIVANNNSAGAPDCDGNPSNLFSNGFNLDSDNTCDFTSPGDLVSANPMLGPLQNNGGPTSTHALLAASQAIEGGTNTGCPATDQRGVGFPRPVNPTCDIGAYEYQLAPPPRADLSLSKIVDNATPILGSNVIFTLTVSNAGPNDTTGVVVTDLLPSGYTYVSDDGGGAYVPGTGLWTVPGTLAASSNATLNITATVIANGVYNNTAEITASAQTDPDSTPNNSITTEDDYAEQATTPTFGGCGPNLVMVTRDGTFVNNFDTPKRTLFESWGYTVTAIDDDDPQATFDAAASNDVMFISESVQSPNINTKARDLNIGIVVEERAIEDDMEFADIHTPTNIGGTQINVSDNTHYITTSFATGNLTVYTAADTLYRTEGTLAPGAQLLATEPGGGFQTLFAFESGTQLDTGTAANRRVGFHFINSSDPVNWNSNLDTLLRRSHEWASCGVAPSADLDLTKTDSADPVPVSTPFTYTLTATNSGPDAANNVTLVDTLPAGVAFQTATPSQGSCIHSGEPLGGTVTCTLGTIANAANATVDIDIDSPITTGGINNSATVSTDPTVVDPPANNTANEPTTIVVAEANLRVTQVDSLDPDGVNLPHTYTVTVTNQGPGSASGVTLVDTLDPAVTYVSATPSQGSCGEAGGVVTCNLGALANGASATIDIIVTNPPTPQTITNTAVVSATEPDFDLTDNTSLEDTSIINPPPTDLELVKTDSPDPVLANGTLTYTLTVTNLGPGPAANVLVVDTLPAGVTFVSATPSVGSCNPPSPTVDCDLGTLPNGDIETVVIVVTAPASAGPITNNASVSTSQVDPNPTNDSASADTVVTVPGGADLSLSKSDSPDPVNVAQTLSYTLDADNLGPDDATGVVLVDTLPATVAYQSATPSQGSCIHSGEPFGGTVTCTLGTIANAVNATVGILVNAPFSTGSITNNASVSTTATDSNPANDNASEDTTVQNFNVNQLCYLVADAGGGGGGNDLLTRIDTADFDPVTNETNIGIGTGTNSIEAIAWNSATGVLYAANAGQLGTLNTTTGVFTALPSPFGTGNGALGAIAFTDIDGLTYDATTGVLYGAERQGGTDVLIQINMATGAHVPDAFGAGIDYVPMLPVVLGNDITDDIAVDPTTGVMYASVNSGGSTDRLITINKLTGATTDIAAITVPDIEGLGTDPTGQLWGTSGTQGILYEIDKATGVGSNGRTIDNGSDYESVDCDAFSPSVVADLAVTKAVDKAAPSEGDSVTYTVQVTNTGPSAATVVQISDPLPAGMTFVSATPTQGAYDSATGNWSVGSLAVTATATLTIQASVDNGTAGSTITNTTSVTFLSQNDPNSGNDSDAVDITPLADADIEFSVATASDLEASGGNKPVLLINGTLTTAQTIDVKLTGGTATPGVGNDFTNTVLVNIPAGVYDGTLGTAVAINLTILDDSLVEGDETIEVDLQNPSLALAIGAQNTHIYTITDDEAAATVQMQAATSSVVEATVGHLVTVQLNSPGGTLDNAVQVDVIDLLTGSATQGAGFDYTYVTPQTVTFAVGNVDGATETVAVNILDDVLLEPTEDIDLQLQNVSGPAMMTTPTSASMTSPSPRATPAPPTLCSP
jgi:uncharacterized repeat protein (TIGR01451 family)